MYIPWALNAGTYIWQGDLFFILRAYTGTGASHSQHRKNSEEVLVKNAGEWTERVEISKEEIPLSKCSMHGNIQTYSSLQRENL